MKKGNVTIKDIANELNLSPSTVSRALADNPLVKPATREMVKKLAKAYNYQPNFTALSLRNSKTKIIGIIIPQIVHEFFALVIRGLEDYAYANGYNVIICSTLEMYEREMMDAKALLNGRVDGIMACLSKETTRFEHFQEFEERGIPIAFFDCICDAVKSHRVIINDFEAGMTVGKHLVEQGCREFAFIGGPKNLSINKGRLNGFRQAIHDAGMALDESRVIHCPTGDYEDGRLLTAGLFDDRAVDGLFAATDMLAIGAMKNIKASGQSIPRDVAVVGFSNWSISELFEPSLSTVNQPGYEMGYKSAELVINQIEKPEETHLETHVLKTELVIRESSRRV